MLNIARYFLLGLLLFSAGCSKDRKPRLEGTVTLDGQPIQDAEVQLVVIPNNRPTAVCGGWTDAAGKFEIRNVTPRSYKVVIRKYRKPDGTTTKQGDGIMMTLSKGKGLTPLVPPEYLDPFKTPLAVDVQDMRQTADFALQSTP